MIRVLKKSENSIIEKSDVLSISEWDFNPKENIWIHLDNPEPDIEKQIFDKFNIHILAVEDAHRGKFLDDMSENQHNPKIEDYEKYLFVVFHKIEVVKGGIKFKQKQLNAFIGENWLITLAYEKFVTIDTVFESVRNNPGHLQKGPDFIFHLILDEIVDKAVPFLENIENYIEEIEYKIFNDPSQSTLNSILQLKKILNRFRRSIFYQKEILFRLSRGEFALITREESIYYRNVYDHLLRALDLIDSFKENIIGLIDCYLSAVSNRLNSIMKVLTVITTIMMPLTFIAGVYGMNFRFIPELEWSFGYPLILLLMLGIGVSMVVYFKRKKWF
jgi:magnesium transporter